MQETKRSGTALAECLSAAFPATESLDREAGLIRIAEFINKVCDALTSKK